MNRVRVYTITVRHGVGSRKKRRMEIRKVGVIGAGQMGSGIAHVCALAGYDVR